VIKPFKSFALFSALAGAAVLLGPAAGRTAAPDAVRVFENSGAAVIENSAVRVEFDLGRGTYRAIDRRTNTAVVEEAFASVGVMDGRAAGQRRTWSERAVEDALGRGRTLALTGATPGYPAILLEITLYEGRSAIVLGLGLDNTTGYPVRVCRLQPLEARAFAGAALDENFRLLDGNGGGEPTRVSEGKSLRSRNNLLATFGAGPERRSLILGGLTYADFEKFARAEKMAPLSVSPDDPSPAGFARNRLAVSVWSEDPVGKLIDAGARYLPADRYYLDFAAGDPFAALEQYGLAVRAAQITKLSPYTFPSVCLWYASVPEYGGGPAINDSPGAVWEIEQAAKRGFLKYSPVAIRLVPDNYEPNNQQGWWDDEHFARLGETGLIIGPHLKPPYETIKKWGQAIRARGGIPLLYMQTARRSEDYASRYPGHMLFNRTDVRATRRDDGHEIWWYGDMAPLWGYDFTDPGFIAHMRDVYANLKSGGVVGLMYDYPATGWAFDGGFEDEHATTASAYRAIFKLAREGLGEDCYLHERNLGRGSDVTLGLVASQRVWGDTDRINPAMASRCGLRWYKNRVAVAYDMDAKNPFRCRPDNRDGWRAMYTMAYVAGGRLLLGASFSKMTDEQLYDLSRTIPYPTAPKSARPVDAFSGVEFPRVYDYAVDARWHQVTFYNTAYDSDEWRKGSAGEKLEPQGRPAASTVGVEPARPSAEGGLGLDPAKRYYVYDFWNAALVGVFPGSARLEQDLRPGEVRMMSVHEVAPNPQFISTNRHVMQGLLDLPRCAWDGRALELRGAAKVIGGEPFKIVIALNGFQPRDVRADGAVAAIRVFDSKAGLAELVLTRPDNGDTEWTARFR
jgi:hypothetical protein